MMFFVLALSVLDTPTPTEPSSSKMPASAIIGIVIASLAAAATIALCIWIFFKGRPQASEPQAVDFTDDMTSDNPHL